MLCIVDLTQLHPEMGGVEIVVHVAGDAMLTVALNVEGVCISRVSVPAGAHVGEMIGKVSGELAMPEAVKPLRRLC